MFDVLEAGLTFIYKKNIKSDWPGIGLETFFLIQDWAMQLRLPHLVVKLIIYVQASKVLRKSLKQGYIEKFSVGF